MALLPSARSKPFDRFTQGRAQLARNVQIVVRRFSVHAATDLISEG